MSVVKINVLEVPAGKGEVLEQRFASRAGEVDTVDGFESFELLRPTEGTERYLVVTKWRDEESFKAWMDSAAFQRGHAQSQPSAGAGQDETAPGSGHPGGQPDGPSSSDEGQPDKAPEGAPKGGPAAVGSELWGFDVVVSSTKK